jgi:hypothetical protein
MSLKSFHIVFVVFTFLMSLFFTLWSFVLAEDISFITRLIGWCGVAGLLLVPVYAVYFWKKAAKIIL